MNDTPSTEMMDRFTEFFDSHYDEAIDDLAQQYPDRRRSLSIDYDSLERFDADLADNYLTKPERRANTLKKHSGSTMLGVTLHSDERTSELTISRLPPP